MRRFFVDKIQTDQALHAITGPEAKHITRVLRMCPGERLILMDATGARYQALIDTVSSKEVLVQIEDPLSAPSPPPVTITLCQAVSKSAAMDDLIQKTSELGVDSINPFFSERTVVRLDKDRLAARMRHWQTVSQNSAKQCNRATPVKIAPPCGFNELVEKWRHQDALKVLLWEGEMAQDFRGLIAASSSQDHVVGMIGPEGGFTRKEVNIAAAAGFVSVSMGGRILRTETAAVTLIAIVQYVWGDLGSRPPQN